MPGIIIDTNIISAVMHVKENALVRNWYFSQDMGSLYLTSITIAELSQGIWHLDKAHPRRAHFANKLAFLEGQFGGQILGFDRDAAHAWGKLRGTNLRQGRTLPELDMQIAAIALVHEMTVATANTRHFEGLGLDLIDPTQR